MAKAESFQKIKAGKDDPKDQKFKIHHVRPSR
jgi:hypothetical protein